MSVYEAFGLAPFTGRPRTTLDQAEVEAKPAWQDRAGCHPRNKPADMSHRDWTDQWFPRRESSDRDLQAALAICDACPVQADCRAYGLNERFGVWGGLPGRQRKIARRTR